jgi:hypothetical protein
MKPNSLRASRSSLLAAFILATGCSAPSGTPDAGDAAHVPDGTPGMDAAPDVPSPDASDAEASVPGPSQPRPGCNPDLGIECDGDWEGRCTPGCAAGECCSPQNGAFRCMPRDADGFCPAADLWFDPTRANVNFEWRYFAANSCVVQERCVNGTGWRRLLKFDTWTPNTGTADMYLGRPSNSNPYFEFSSCHRHYHFNTYADYQLLSTADGGVMATGHKQAFCLEDFYLYPMPPEMMREQGAHYNCSNQGIQRGWQDVYGQYLDCQWVDITDVPAGEYTLRVALNTDRILAETDYSNNVGIVPVTIPPDETSQDPTQPCAAGAASTGLDRACGFHLAGPFTCTPGTAVRAGCSAACGTGSCTGDTVLRVCAGDAPCAVQDAIGWNDNSGCTSGDRCSRAQFNCPASGRYVVLWAAADESNAATTSCTVATR